MTHYPPMPKTQAEWELHWDFYQLTVKQRDLAWRTIRGLQSRIKVFEIMQTLDFDDEPRRRRVMDMRDISEYPQHVSDGDDCP